MAAGVITFLYRRLGSRYPLVFMALELQTALLIVAGTLALFTFYFDGSVSEYLIVLGVALALTECAILVSLWRLLPQIRPLRDWIAGARDEESTQRAWNAAAGLPIVLLRRDLPVPILISVIPICVVGIVVLDLSALAIFPLLGAAAVAMGYSAILHYLYVEAGMRPVLLDINSSLSPGRATNFWAVSLRTRLLVALPVINLITGLVVAALTSDGGGPSNLGLDVLIALLVATTISLELTVLFSKSILRPLGDLENALEKVREGDYDVSVPVTTGDEVGELAASFNQMVEGLAEREQLREAFGTYLDRDVAEYILSEGFSEEGVEIEVSVLFCDVRGFTEFASEATPQEVVAALNELFETAVPIIAGHGGHIDKFEGDGLLAVFGAPEPFADHADRAVRAACEIATSVNHEGRGGELHVGVGVNSGPVIAGAIGGGGRLNFSVIGGVVNVASRVEQHTRETGDDILITAATWTAVSHRFEVESRGKVELRGVAEPVALYAPHRVGEPAVVASSDRDGRSEADADGRSGADANAEAGRRRRLPLPRLLR
jgi:adenylate cyclase